MTTNEQIGARIRQRREELGLTLEELGDQLSLNKSTIMRYESGEVQKIKLPILQSLAQALDVDPNWLALKTDVAEPYYKRTIPTAAYLMGWEEDESTATSSPNAVKIPVLGRVAAGLPITAVENILDYEEIPHSLAATGEFVALQIKGQSMEPRIYEGDIVIVRVQPTAETGDLAVVIVNGDEATVKKIKILPEGILLQPFNPTYQPMFYSCSDIENKPVRIFGKVVELRAKF